MHRSRIQASSHRISARRVTARSRWLRLMFPCLAIFVCASAVRAADEVDLASFEEAAIDETPEDMTPKIKLSTGKGSAAEAPLPDETAFSLDAVTPDDQMAADEKTVRDEKTVLDETLPDETPAGESPPPAAKAAPSAKASLRAKPAPRTKPTTSAKGAPLAESMTDETPTADEKTTKDAKATLRERLVVGDAYTIEVKRGGVTQTFGGNLLKATDHWIVLRRMATGRNDYGVPLLSALPKVGNYFRRSYESLVEDDLWIPREAATIETHRHVDTAAAARNIPANEPPPKAHCGVAFVHDEKFVRRDGQISAIDAENVTLTLMTPFHSQYQQQLARDEILCISIPIVLSNVRMTHRDDKQARK